MVEAAAGTITRPAAQLRGRLTLPSDKSIAHRALIVNALGGGPASVEVEAPGDDVRSTVGCLRALGVSVGEERSGSWTTFSLFGVPSSDAAVDCGNSGTTMRLLAGALAGLPLRTTLDGDDSLRARPMERLAALLRATGAEVTTTDGHAPITVTGRSGLAAVTHRLPVASAQLLGATALAALAADGTTRIHAPAAVRDHTERMLDAAGVTISREGLLTTVEGPARPRPLTMRMPGDASAATPWLVAAALHPDADVTLVGVGLNPTRTGLLDLLRRMGADVSSTITDATGPEPIGEIRVRGGRELAPIEVAGDEVAALIDELPLVGVLMAGASGTSELRDAAELRVKESDRIAATVAGLIALGASVEERPDGWRVSRGKPREARVATYGDHRIAIAFAIAALAGIASAVELDDPHCVTVSYPTFWADVVLVAA
jgi:3-phosphoshikimate 1-carboxyvinyltransferase